MPISKEWISCRLREYLEEFLRNLPVACHGCAHAFLAAPGLEEPDESPDIELDFLDLELLCPLLPAELFEGLR